MSERNRSGSRESGPDPQAAPPPARPAAQAGQTHSQHEQDSTADGSTQPDPAERIAELEDQRLRALADLDNLRKRCVTQVRSARAEAEAEVAAKWLPVVDNLERALAHAQADPGSIIEGIKAVEGQAMAVLAQLGFPRRDDLGASFDPARHQAIATRADDSAAAGSVVDVVLPAYGDGDHQLRPAQVVVAKAD